MFYWEFGSSCELMCLVEREARVEHLLDLRLILHSWSALWWLGVGIEERGWSRLLS
jgi:hypothetical protein